MKHLKFAVPLAFLVLMLAMGSPLAHADIGNYNPYWRSTSCGGSTQYMSYTIWGNNFAAYDSDGNSNSFSYQLNVLIVDGTDPTGSTVNYWVQVALVPQPDGTNFVFMQLWNQSSDPTGTNPITVSTTSFSHYFVVGDQVWIGLDNIGDGEIEGSVVVENVDNSFIYAGYMTYTFSSWTPRLVSAYEGLYGPGDFENATFTWHDYTGNDYMTYQYLYSSASSPTYTDYYAEGCYGAYNIATGEASNLSYGNVDESGQYLFYSFG